MKNIHPDCVTNTMLATDLIAELQSLPADALVCITHEGYYSCGEMAEIFPTPQQLSIGGCPANVYTLGHSEQNP